MAHRSSIRNIRLGAALTAFMAAAAFGACAGMGEGTGEHGSGGAEAGGEESGALLALDQTYDTVRGGARLILRYDAAENAFIGTVRNVTDGILQQVRVEVHLSNGIELGPTEPVDLAPGAAVPVRLAAGERTFTGWTPHAEVGPGGAAGGEHGPGGEAAGGEHGGGEGGHN